VFLIGHEIRAALWITGLPADLFHGLLLWTVCTRVELELPASGNHGMRRTHPRRHKDILKRQLIHVGGFNLSLILRQLLGAGTPRDWRNRGVAVLLLLYFLLTYPEGRNRQHQTRIFKLPCERPPRRGSVEHAAGRSENDPLTPRAAKLRAAIVGGFRFEKIQAKFDRSSIYSRRRNFLTDWVIDSELLKRSRDGS
jgi:hypothetical protein